MATPLPTLATDVAENPLSGEHITFTTSPPGTADAVRFDFVVAPGGGVPFRHQHARQSEVMRCTHGALTIALADQNVELRAGHTLTIPPGTLHSMHNHGDESAHCEVEYRPAGRSEQWLKLVFAHARTNGKPPSLLDLAPFIADVDIYQPGPVLPQRLLFRVLKPIAILLGRRRAMLRAASETYGQRFAW